MKITEFCKPYATAVTVALSVGESVVGEADSMILHSAGIQTTIVSGKVSSALRRKALGGENALLTKYTATKEGAWVTLAPSLPGDVETIPMQDDEIVLQQGGFLCATGDIDVTANLSGPSRMLMKEGVSEIRVRGTGKLLISSYGGLLPATTLRQGSRMVADTGHVVAYDSSVQVKVKTHGGVIKSLASGEGLVAQLTGPGRVYFQTRSEQNTISHLFPTRKQNR